MVPVPAQPSPVVFTSSKVTSTFESQLSVAVTLPPPVGIASVQLSVTSAGI